MSAFDYCQSEVFEFQNSVTAQWVVVWGFVLRPLRGLGGLSLHPAPVELGHVLDEVVPVLEARLAEAAGEAPPLRVDAHVVLELVLVAQLLVADLNGDGDGKMITLSLLSNLWIIVPGRRAPSPPRRARASCAA